MTGDIRKTFVKSELNIPWILNYSFILSCFVFNRYQSALCLCVYNIFPNGCLLVY